MGSNTQTTNQNQTQNESSQNTGSQTQNQASASNPWAPTMASLQNLINQINGGGGQLTSGQQSALSNLQSAANAVPNFGNAASGALNNVYNTAPQTGLLSSAYNTSANTLSPYLSSSYTNPFTTPGFSQALSTMNQDITNQINGEFAAAGRSGAGSPSGGPSNADATQALARGLSQGEGQLIANQYNANVGQQQNAVNQLLGGAGNTASGISNIYNNAANTGTANAGLLSSLYTSPATTQLSAANTAYSQPYQNTAIPQSLLTQLAGLGTQSTGTGTGTNTSSGTSLGNLISNSTVSQPVNPWTTLLGGVLGGGALLGGNSGLLSALGLSDARLKENIEPVGILNNGLNIYRYNFKGSPRTEIGVMAQEVEQTRPDAVVDVPVSPNATVKMVDYARATAA